MIELFFVILSLLALLFYPHLLLCRSMETQVRREGGLYPCDFFFEVLVQTFAILMLWLVLFAMLLVAMASVGGIAAFAGFLALVLGGLVGWAKLYLNRRAEISKAKECGAHDSIPRHQLWLQDVYVALAVYGSCLVGLALLFPLAHSDAGVLVPWALYFMASTGTGILASTDMFRFAKSSQSGRARAIFILKVLVVFILFLPLSFWAWLAWRRTVRWELMRDAAADKKAEEAPGSRSARVF